MNYLKKFQDIDNKWFFSRPPLFFRLFLIYIKGDIFILFPFAILLIILSFFTLKLAGIMLGLYIGIRSLGEVLYWLLQQFGARSYRPHDYGLKNLDNHAIYIMYQTWSITATVIGFSLTLYILFFMR